MENSLSSPVFTVDHLSYRYPGSLTAALVDVSCAVAEGECLCLTGNSGCGKSTLLLALMGLLQGGALTGSVELAGHPDQEGSSAAAIVFQNPESQLLCTTVAEEVAFGPENLCVDPVEIGLRVARALRAVGLEGREERSPERFSAGQKQRVAIASVLSMQPELLLLDEPTSQLDAPGKLRLAGILGDLKRQGYTIVLAEHDPRPFADLIDRYLVLNAGELVRSTRSLPDPANFQVPPGRQYPAAAAKGEGEAPHLQVSGLSLSYPEAGLVLDQVELSLERGLRVQLYGKNGAGKSTLLRCLSGLERPDAGSVSLAGLTDPSPEALPGKVGVLFQNPARQLFADTVHEEVCFTLRRLGYPREQVASLAAETLSFCGIQHLAQRAPLTLSFGEQHRVALAAVLAPRPELLLLDEPFAGLDYPQRFALLEILGRLPANRGTTVLIASHDELPDPGWADRTFLLQGGRLAEVPR